MIYIFKPAPEVVRGLFIAVATVVLQMLIATDLTRVTDWRTWAIALAAAAVHAAGVYLFSWLTAPPPPMAATVMTNEFARQPPAPTPTPPQQPPSAPTGGT